MFKKKLSTEIEERKNLKNSTDQTVYGIGIDTGGTYTDAVLMNLKTCQVVKSSKRPTVHHDLKKGIVEALTDVLSYDKSIQIAQIAFSTTLATNALAEGGGAGVGLIVIGQVKHLDLPVVSVRFVDGGHDHMGKEIKPLDIESIVDAVSELKGHVDAYAIAAAMSIENPVHEQVAAKAVELVDSKPVFCSHLISRKPGIKERAATAVLHARLMPVIKGFVDHLKKLKGNVTLSSKMRIIQGYATAIDLDEAILRAAATLGGGPAATAFYGAKFVAAKRALVVDIGGTTTDMTLIENGQPVISNRDSIINKWRTHIDAVAIL